MTPAELRAAGEALYGPRWQTALADSLGVSARTMRRWAAGEWPVPDLHASTVRYLLGARHDEIGRLLAD